MSTALYRRYRPETFAEVIGQNHVTEPLMAALRANRVTHAYLFSGPRGCGKTTSARILARCLNCAQGPTDTPCGQCESCRELATGGPGSLDVVEIDAASHNGVDDARELRERATFAPVRDRYKVFILDEAHMVTPQGFNALLKLVEEPPEHVKFIFATTEPERVIGTIRSRTHHYPFRLVPGEVMVPFLEELCRRESISVGEGVLPLVVRAGGGSVRDSLSVLDQLMAGGVAGEVSYQRAVSLLGYTDSALIDDVVEGLAERDGVRVFATVERMVEAGHDPRRFVEDFLQRLRDLLIITVTGEGARDFLVGVPKEQHDRMFEQAQRWGGQRLSGAADVADQALRQMVGATSPRLQLELLMGRLLMLTQSGVTGLAPAQSATPVSDPAPGGSLAPSSPAAAPADAKHEGATLSGAALAREELRRVRQARQQSPTPTNTGPAPEDVAAVSAPTDPKPEPSRAPSPAVTAPTASPATEEDRTVKQPPAEPAHATSATSIGSRWEEFLDAVEQLRHGWRKPIGENVRWVDEDEQTLTVVFAQASMRDSFIARGNLKVFAQAAQILTGSTREIVALGPDDRPVPTPSCDRESKTATPDAGATTAAPQATPTPASESMSQRSDRQEPLQTAAQGSRQTSAQNPPQSTAQEPQRVSPPAPGVESAASSGWGPIAVAGGGINQDLSSSTTSATSSVPTRASQKGDVISADVSGDEGVDFKPAPDASPTTSPSPIEPEEPTQAPTDDGKASAAKAEAELAANVAAEQGETDTEISLSVKPAPPEEEIGPVQPGVPVSMDNDDVTSANRDDDDPTGGASLDDADTEAVIEVGLPVIERVFNVTHFEEITEEE